MVFYPLQKKYEDFYLFWSFWLIILWTLSDDGMGMIQKTTFRKDTIIQLSFGNFLNKWKILAYT